MSLPIRIALVAALAVAGLWMVVLKPKAVADGPPAPTPAAAAPAAPAPTEASAEPKPAPAPAPAAPRTTVLALVGEGEDDAVARDLVGELRGVRALVVPIDRVGRYADLLGGVEIRSTPTILVIGPDRTAQRIEGLPDAAQLEQALAAARR